MNILFINLKDIQGGAAIAAYRLNKGLEKYHHTENHLIVNHKFSTDWNVFSILHHSSETVQSVKTFIQFMVNKFFNRFGLQYVYIPFSPSFILKKVRELKPDIISLHITHGGYFPTALIKKLSKMAPIVWTLHDMWPFTANAVHTFGDEAWKQLRSGKGEKIIYPHIGMDTGKWLLKRKKRIYAKSNFQVVAPSRWMQELALQSPVFENKTIHYITHGLDLDMFKPLDKISCKKAVGLPPNEPVFMFSSADDLERSAWKGGQLLVDVLTAIDSLVPSDTSIHVLVLGKGKLTRLQHLKNLQMHQLGHIESETCIRTLLNASDLFIYPTRADSLGLVLVESIACGVPAITFDVGGPGDVIKDGYNGYLIRAFDVPAFAERTMELLQDNSRRELFSTQAREYACRHFDLALMAQKYIDVFKNLCEENFSKNKNL